MLNLFRINLLTVSPNKQIRVVTVSLKEGGVAAPRVVTVSPKEGGVAAPRVLESNAEIYQNSCEKSLKTKNYDVILLFCASAWRSCKINVWRGCVLASYNTVD